MFRFVSLLQMNEAMCVCACVFLPIYFVELLSPSKTQIYTNTRYLIVNNLFTLFGYEFIFSRKHEMLCRTPSGIFLEVCVFSRLIVIVAEDQMQNAGHAVFEMERQ